MRAVLRCNVRGKSVEALRSLYQSNDPAYEAAIIKLFEGVGFKPISKFPEIGPQDPIVSGVFDHVPSDIKDEELKRIVLTGYTSDGQAHFVVCAIHHDRLHVRTHADTFLRLSKSCAEFYGKLPSAVERLWRYFRGLTYMKLDPLIQVLEPRQEVPTIMGKAIGGSVHAAKEASRRERVSVLLMLIGLATIGIVLSGNSWAWSQLLKAPIFPPLAVFVVSNCVPVVVTFGHYYFKRPIVWDNKIEDGL